MLLLGLCLFAAACRGGAESVRNQVAGTGGNGQQAWSDPDAQIPSNPTATCAVPAVEADVTTPATIVGNGIAASCTEQALRSAVAVGGIITFDCGPDPVTIAVTSELAVVANTTIDGGGKITLSGNNASRIAHIKSAWNVATPLLTLQHLTFVDGYTTDVPNTRETTQGGAAIFQDGGSLTVIDCTFAHNHCASSGEDVSGGAINGQGVGDLTIVGSVFVDNSGSNGGAVGTQGENVTAVNTAFSGNTATGTDGNPGNGGDGGALSYDGENISLTLCGDTFSGNSANAAGGAVFRVAYSDEPVVIDRCTFDGNSVDNSAGNAGGLYLENVTITMTATTISNNGAHYGGGLWIGQSAIANLTNVTIANNKATMGAGVWFANQVTGTFANCTIAGNANNGLFGGNTAVKLMNSIVANNSAQSGGDWDHSTNCQVQHAAAGPVIQYPLGGGVDCTPSVTYADPLLGPLQDNGGATETLAVLAGSPAIGVGSGCPAYDQRGIPRPSDCTLGAYEAD